jgi:hypothetical protein
MEVSMVSEVVELPDLKVLAAAGSKHMLEFGSTRLYIQFAGGIGYIWYVFGSPLGPNQIGEVTFTNVPGTLPVSGCFGEWVPTTNQPNIGGARYTLLCVQRGFGNALIRGLNTYGANLVSAAGLICFLE